MARKRLTRKEIVQQDQIELGLAAIYNWCSENRFLIISILAVFVLTIVGSSAWTFYQAQSLDELQKRFNETLSLYHTPVNNPQDPPAEDAPEIEYLFESNQERLEESLGAFTEIVEASPNSKIGLLSRYYTGVIQQQLGQTEDAKNDFDFIIQNASRPEIQNLSRHYLARLAQSNNDREQAKALLEQLLVDESNTFPKAVALLELARTYEGEGNTEAALRYYQRLTEEYPTSQHIQQARAHISQLENVTGQD
ncbi:MAG: tetratricopeptide repeat protein [Acidobacteriota bacterium]|nr:tetratricopeptide repeat protein [Acidobacteriota bacterium]